MSDEPRIITNEDELRHARALETRGELDAMAATIRALWKERDALTNLGCKAVDLTTEISEGAGKEIAELRAMVDTKIEQVVTFCRGEADAIFITTPHSVPLGTIDRIGKALRERLGEDTLVVLLEGDAKVETLDEKEMRKLGWARCGDLEGGTDLLVIPAGAKRCPDCNGSGHFPRPKDEELTGEFPAPIEKATIEALPCLTCNGLGVVDAVSLPGFLNPLPAPPTCERPSGDCPDCDDRHGSGCREIKPCPTCSGTGTVPGAFLSHVRHECETCGGLGFISTASATCDRPNSESPNPSCGYREGDDPDECGFCEKDPDNCDRRD